MGAAQAARFVGEGAQVVLADITAAGEILAASLGSAAAFRHHDVTDAQQWESLTAFTEQRFGRVDILVNNAGVCLPGSLEETGSENWDAHLAVNQTGIYLGMRAVIAPMRRSGAGSIVNLSSAAGFRGTPGLFGYVASKWAVRGMTKAAANELAADRIRVNSIHPGVIETPMVANMPAEWHEGVCKVTPLGRLGTADEVALLALYLASDESSYTTGAEIAIDGAATA